MFALLAILGMALAVGKLARRITPAVELVLLLVIALIVVAEYMSWSHGGLPSPREVLQGLIRGSD
ncbi:MAG TPA: hypothetical protein VGW35_16955 [Methylomirabilota bacterium]|jgi:hypothetical protein|nr:hypothetical protein [Methylomirabilota bacterium]